MVAKGDDPFLLGFTPFSGEFQGGYMGVSKNRGTPKSWILILIGFSIINHAFGGTPIFWNNNMLVEKCHADQVSFLRLMKECQLHRKEANHQGGWHPGSCLFVLCWGGFSTNPPKEGLNYKQNKGHLGSRYIYNIVKKYGYMHVHLLNVPEKCHTLFLQPPFTRRLCAFSSLPFKVGLEPDVASKINKQNRTKKAANSTSYKVPSSQNWICQLC